MKSHKIYPMKTDRNLVKATLLAVSTSFTVLVTTHCYAQVNYKTQLTQMFHEMVEKKDISKRIIHKD